jgi:hypothetical protein
VARTKGGPKPNLAFAEGGVAWFDLQGLGVVPSVRAGVRKEFGPVGLRVAFDWAGRNDTGGSITYQFQYFGGSAALLWPITESAFFLEVGPQLTYGYATQNLPASPSFSSGIFGAGAAVMATFPIGPLRLGVDASGAAQIYKLNDKTVVRPGASAGLLLLFGF